jgi:FAD/FMN-containing dehydrogenase
MDRPSYASWGRYPRSKQRVRHVNWRQTPLPLSGLKEETYVLPRGNGRSYGDVCLNDRGVLLDCRGLDRFIAFDATTGVLRCEAGVLLSDILELVVDQGWFLPVTPGTQFVTIGGAIANDVHGKNHYGAGTFGKHVRHLELARSDGSHVTCSADENSKFYRGTIGGLGLTGIITWAEIQLRSVDSAFIDQEVIRHSNLAEFFTLARESDEDYEHTVAWIDCRAQGQNLGRGLFTRGNHAQPTEQTVKESRFGALTMPLDPPFTLINGWTLKAFNTIYFNKQRVRRKRQRVHYRPFFYPLDSIKNWNRIYGRSGFFQYQCVLPTHVMEDATHEILERIGRSGRGSFLAVLKTFGDNPSPGLLSFPMPGATLALDFPNEGERTLRLLDELDEVTRAAGGRINPSKDARMSAKDFQSGYPGWTELETLRDPRISSDFWRRVTIDT